MEKIAVAMSGGVDSSLVAALLLKNRFQVVGITMLLDDNQISVADAKMFAIFWA